jgi:hypothetical protein
MSDVSSSSPASPIAPGATPIARVGHLRYAIFMAAVFLLSASTFVFDSSSWAKWQLDTDTSTPVDPVNVMASADAVQTIASANAVHDAVSTTIAQTVFNVGFNESERRTSRPDATAYEKVWVIRNPESDTLTINLVSSRPMCLTDNPDDVLCVYRYHVHASGFRLGGMLVPLPIDGTTTSRAYRAQIRHPLSDLPRFANDKLSFIVLFETVVTASGGYYSTRGLRQFVMFVSNPARVVPLPNTDSLDVKTALANKLKQPLCSFNPFIKDRMGAWISVTEQQHITSLELASLSESAPMFFNNITGSLQQFAYVLPGCRVPTLTPESYLSGVQLTQVGAQTIDIIIIGTSRVRDMFNSLNEMFNSTARCNKGSWNQPFVQIADKIRASFLFLNHPGKPRKPGEPKPPLALESQKAQIEKYMASIYGDQEDLTRPREQHHTAFFFSVGTWESDRAEFDSSQFESYVDPLVSTAVSSFRSRTHSVVMLGQQCGQRWNRKTLPSDKMTKATKAEHAGFTQKGGKCMYFEGVTNPALRRVAQVRSYKYMSADYTMARHDMSPDHAHYKTTEVSQTGVHQMLLASMEPTSPGVVDPRWGTNRQAGNSVD